MSASHRPRRIMPILRGPIPVQPPPVSPLPPTPSPSRIRSSPANRLNLSEASSFFGLSPVSARFSEEVSLVTPLTGTARSMDDSPEQGSLGRPSHRFTNESTEVLSSPAVGSTSVAAATLSPAARSPSLHQTQRFILSPSGQSPVALSAHTIARLQAARASATTARDPFSASTRLKTHLHGAQAVQRWQEADHMAFEVWSAFTARRALRSWYRATVLWKRAHQHYVERTKALVLEVWRLRVEASKRKAKQVVDLIVYRGKAIMRAGFRAWRRSVREDRLAELAVVFQRWRAYAQYSARVRNERYESALQHYRRKLLLRCVRDWITPVRLDVHLRNLRKKFKYLYQKRIFWRWRERLSKQQSLVKAIQFSLRIVAKARIGLHFRKWLRFTAFHKLVHQLQVKRQARICTVVLARWKSGMRRHQRQQQHALDFDVVRSKQVALRRWKLAFARIRHIGDLAERTFKMRSLVRHFKAWNVLRLAVQNKTMSATRAVWKRWRFYAKKRQDLRRYWRLQRLRRAFDILKLQCRLYTGLQAVIQRRDKRWLALAMTRWRMALKARQFARKRIFKHWQRRYLDRIITQRKSRAALSLFYNRLATRTLHRWRTHAHTLRLGRYCTAAIRLRKLHAVLSQWCAMYRDRRLNSHRLEQWRVRTLLVTFRGWRGTVRRAHGEGVRAVKAARYHHQGVCKKVLGAWKLFMGVRRLHHAQAHAVRWFSAQQRMHRLAVAIRQIVQIRRLRHANFANSTQRLVRDVFAEWRGRVTWRRSLNRAKVTADALAARSLLRGTIHVWAEMTREQHKSLQIVLLRRRFIQRSAFHHFLRTVRATRFLKQHSMRHAFVLWRRMFALRHCALVLLRTWRQASTSWLFKAWRRVTVLIAVQRRQHELGIRMRRLLLKRKALRAWLRYHRHKQHLMRLQYTLRSRHSVVLMKEQVRAWRSHVVQRRARLKRGAQYAQDLQTGLLVGAWHQWKARWSKIGQHRQLVQVAQPVALRLRMRVAFDRWRYGAHVWKLRSIWMKSLEERRLRQLQINVLRSWQKWSLVSARRHLLHRVAVQVHKRVVMRRALTELWQNTCGLRRFIVTLPLQPISVSEDSQPPPSMPTYEHEVAYYLHNRRAVKSLLRVWNRWKTFYKLTIPIREHHEQMADIYRYSGILRAVWQIWRQAQRNSQITTRLRATISANLTARSFASWRYVVGQTKSNHLVAVQHHALRQQRRLLHAWWSYTTVTASRLKTAVARRERQELRLFWTLWKQARPVASAIAMCRRKHFQRMQVQMFRAWRVQVVDARAIQTRAQGYRQLWVHQVQRMEELRRRHHLQSVRMFFVRWRRHVQQLNQRARVFSKRRRMLNAFREWRMNAHFLALQHVPQPAVAPPPQPLPQQQQQQQYGHQQSHQQPATTTNTRLAYASAGAAAKPRQSTHLMLRKELRSAAQQAAMAALENRPPFVCSANTTKRSRSAQSVPSTQVCCLHTKRAGSPLAGAVCHCGKCGSAAARNRLSDTVMQRVRRAVADRPSRYEIALAMARTEQQRLETYEMEQLVGQHTALLAGADGGRGAVASDYIPGERTPRDWDDVAHDGAQEPRQAALDALPAGPARTYLLRRPLTPTSPVVRRAPAAAFQSPKISGFTERLQGAAVTSLGVLGRGASPKRVVTPPKPAVPSIVQAAMAADVQVGQQFATSLAQLADESLARLVVL